jgi:hypothetical protein
MAHKAMEMNLNQYSPKEETDRWLIHAAAIGNAIRNAELEDEYGSKSSCS